MGTTEILPAGSYTWEEGPEIPVEMFRGPCAVAISATSFLVFHEKEIREFDASTAGPTSNQGWAAEAKWPKMVRSRKWPGCAKLGDDKVVIAGGLNYDRTLRTTEILNLSTRILVERGKMKTPRYSFHIISFPNNGVFTTLAVGGGDNDGKELNTVEKWRPESEIWSTVETRFKEKRKFFGLVAVNKNLVCH